MKKFSVLLAMLFVAMILVPTFSVSAADAEILYGTPAIDGVLDEMYTYSAKVELDNFEFYSELVGAGGPTTCEGTVAYILWDDTYLYVCAVINDETRTETVDANVDYHEWNTNDNLEFYLWDDDERGGGIHSNAIAGGYKFDCEGVAEINAAGTATSTGYVTEVAVKIADLFKLKANTEFNFALQYNDYLPDGTVHASGQQWFDAALRMKLSADAAPVPETEAPAPETEAPTSAQTFDIIGFAAAAVISGGIVLSKKSCKK